MNENTKRSLEYSAHYINRDSFVDSFRATIADSQELDELEIFVSWMHGDRNKCTTLDSEFRKMLEKLGVEVDELKVSKSLSKEEKFFELIERDLVDVCCEFEYEFYNEEEPKKMSQAQVDHYISRIRKIFLEIKALEDADFEDKNCEDEGFQ